MPSRSTKGEFAGIVGGQDVTRPFEQRILQSQDPLYLAQAGGISLREYVLSDDMVRSCMQQRVALTRAAEWEVTPGGPRAIDKKAADFLRAEIDALDWDTITGLMLYGVIFGYSIAECIWWIGPRGMVHFDRERGGIRVRNRRRFAWAPDFSLRLITLTSSYEGIPVPDRKFWTAQWGGDNSDDPYGRGLELYFLVFLKKNLRRFSALYAEKYASPTAVVEYDPNALEAAPGSVEAQVEVEQKYLKLALNVAANAGVAIPKGCDLSFLEASRGGSADYTEMIRELDLAISRVILSQTMTTHSGGSLAQAYVHKDIGLAVSIADSDMLDQSFRNGPATWITNWNFNGAAVPFIRRKLEPKEDLRAVAERDKILSTEMGLQLAKEYLIQTYGDIFVFEDPAETEESAALSDTQTELLLSIIEKANVGKWSPELLAQVLNVTLPNLGTDQIAALSEAISESADDVEDPIDPEDSLDSGTQAAASDDPNGTQGATIAAPGGQPEGETGIANSVI